MKRRVAQRIGTRGEVLALLGVIWFILGITVAGHHKPVLLHERAPEWFAVLVWSTPGGFAAVASVWRRMDPTAWALLTLGPMVRLCSYGFGWITSWGFIPGAWQANYSYPDGWRGLLVWSAVAIMVTRCAAGLDRPAPWNGEERRRWVQADGQPSA